MLLLLSLLPTLKTLKSQLLGYLSFTNYIHVIAKLKGTDEHNSSCIHLIFLLSGQSPLSTSVLVILGLYRPKWGPMPPSSPFKLLPENFLKCCSDYFTSMLTFHYPLLIKVWYSKDSSTRTWLLAHRLLPNGRVQCAFSQRAALQDGCSTDRAVLENWLS